MSLKNIVLGAIVSGIMGASAIADEIYLKTPVPILGKRMEMIEGEIVSEEGEMVTIKFTAEMPDTGELKSAGITVPKSSIEKIVKKPYDRDLAAKTRMEKREPILKVRRMAQEFKDSAPELAKQAAEIAKKSIEDGKASYIYAYNDWLFAIDFDKDIKGNATIKRAYENHNILPALLDIADLRKLTRYPNLEAKKGANDSIDFEIGDAKEVSVRKVSLASKDFFNPSNTINLGYTETDDGRFRIYAIEGFHPGREMMRGAGGSIVHPTKEKINGVNFPKKLAFTNNPSPVFETVDYRHFVYPEFWDLAYGTLLGKINVNGTDYFAVDSFAPEQIVKEYYPLRQKSEEEKNKFSEPFKANFMQKEVKIGSKKFTYLATGKEELEQCIKAVDEAAKTELKYVCGEKEKGIFKDYLFSERNSREVDKIVAEAKTIDDLVNALENVFKTKNYQLQSAGMLQTLDEIAKGQKYNCMDYASLAANTFRKAGVPALINQINPQGEVSHAIAEIYLPKQDLVIYLDIFGGRQAYIFKPSSKDIFNCKFDARIFGNNREYLMASAYVDKPAIAQKSNEAHNREMKHTEESRKILGYFEKPKE